jgi:hypothetical protein
MNDLLKYQTILFLVAAYKLIKMKLIFFKNYAAGSLGVIAAFFWHNVCVRT